MALTQVSPEEQAKSQVPQLPHELLKSTQPPPQMVRLGSLQRKLHPPSVHTAYPLFGAVQVTPPQVMSAPMGIDGPPAQAPASIVANPSLSNVFSKDVPR
jgi:hypothetical protein